MRKALLAVYMALRSARERVLVVNVVEESEVVGELVQVFATPFVGGERPGIHYTDQRQYHIGFPSTTLRFRSSDDCGFHFQVESCPFMLSSTPDFVLFPLPELSFFKAFRCAFLFA
jgi:hypothetical protein